MLTHWIGIGLYLLRVVDNHGLKRIFLVPMAYESPARLDALAREFVVAELPNYLYPDITHRLMAHQRLGHQVVIISASAEFYLHHLQVLFPGVLTMGTRLDFRRQGWLRLPRYIGGNLKGPEKNVRLKEELGLEPGKQYAFAYSDHHSDRFLLELAQYPICVAPSVKMRLLAQKNQWPVWEQAKPIPAWRVKLHKLKLLLWAGGRTHSVTLPEGFSVPKVLTPEELHRHTQALRKRVEAQGPVNDMGSDPVDGDTIRYIFPPSV